MANNNRSRIHALVKALMKMSSAVIPEKVTVGWPSYDHREISGALDALLDLRISQGPRVKEFEALSAKYIGVKHAVAVNSGSSANLLALTALMQSGKLPKGSEVILPATTFATVASPILQLGLIPVYVDIDEKSWNLDPKQIEKAISKKTRVIMAVHTFGNPADMPAIMKIAKKHDLIVLEDCCEAHGARIGKKVVGSFGHIATWSFFVAHNITTGEGGMVLTNEAAFAEVVRSLREFGRLTGDTGRFNFNDPKLGAYDTRYVFTRLGYNVRMTDIEAALGIAQIQKLDALNKKRVSIVEKYVKGLQPYTKYLRLPTIRRGDFHSYYGFPFAIEQDAPFTRAQLSKALEARGVETRPFFGGNLPDQPAFRDEPKRIVGKLPVAKWVRDNGVFIGCHPHLTQKHVQLVLSTVRDFFQTKLNQ